MCVCVRVCVCLVCVRVSCVCVCVSCVCACVLCVCVCLVCVRVSCVCACVLCVCMCLVCVWDIPCQVIQPLHHHPQIFLMLFIKENLPSVKNIEYFSDGCAGQYKSFKAFLNLSHHQSDFALDATWTFFATSHGKSLCDGIGGTVKRKVLRTSLQRPVDNQILTFRAIEDFCKTPITGVTFMVIDSQDMEPVRENLKSQYKLGDTVPGTRSCHHFVPTSMYTIEGKQLSIDTVLFVDHSFLNMPASQNETVESLKPNDYVTCCFDGFWWLVLIDAVNKEEKDLTCKFLHSHGPSNQFHWPRGDDRGYVPFNKVIMKIETPRTSVNERTLNYFDRQKVL